jgi:hypothetical protein
MASSSLIGPIKLMTENNVKIASESRKLQKILINVAPHCTVAGGNLRLVIGNGAD